MGTLVVLAQCGCYVPAAAMSLPPFHCLLTRMGSSDCLTAAASSFMVECREMAGEDRECRVAASQHKPSAWFGSPIVSLLLNYHHVKTTQCLQLEQMIPLQIAW